MGTAKATNNPTRSIFMLAGVVILVAIFLGIYLLKYVPSQRQDFNQRAFLELGQVAKAFDDRDEAYQQVINSINDESNPLEQLWALFPHHSFSENKRNGVALTARIDKDAANRWQLYYTTPVTPLRQKGNTLLLEKDLDTLMHSLTDNDQDIFDSYLLILDTNQSDSKSHEGRIVFNPRSLSMDYPVDLDTLFKKGNGLSLLNILDAKTEGDDYKVFLYPFQFHQQQLVMAGLISDSRYTRQYESVPVDLITFGGILLLLLLVAIPFLKIYIIGSHERITNFDLRMIIGSYFVGGFVLFFLLTWNFLESSQTATNRENLSSLSDQIQQSFFREIHLACDQLRDYDRTYWSKPDLRAVLEDKVYNVNKMSGMHPTKYLQFDDIFWIGTEGKWTGRYGFRLYPDLPLIPVDDRQYFKDVKAGNLLHLKHPLKDDSSHVDDFCLQPTLSKLDGGFVVNLLIRSNRPVEDEKGPIMVGLSGQFYSVCNNALPPGYNFSVVDDKGLILFDSRNGRHLLSNIYADVAEQTSLAQSIQYRQDRFFSSITLHGDEVALLVTPFSQIPYTMLVYYDRDNDKTFQLHVRVLTCFFMAWVILLVILSTYFNEWSRVRPSLSNISSVNFDWLRPSPEKAAYYWQLVLGTGMLTGFYLAVGVILEFFDTPHEFALFVVSLLLPFNLAIHYYLLRQKQKSFSDDNAEPMIPKAALLIPALTIGVVLIYILPSTLGATAKTLILGIQLAFSGLTGWSWWLLKDQKKAEPERSEPSMKETMPGYVAAITIGMFALVTVPACGIFCFFYKEEMRTRIKQERLSFASGITQRMMNIGEIKNEETYLLYLANPLDSLFVDNLKTQDGIYYPDKYQHGNTPDESHVVPAHPPKMYYDLRNFLFTTDHTALTFGSRPERAGDSTWFFQMIKDSEEVVRINPWSRNPDIVHLALSHNAHLSALKLLGGDIRTLGPTNILLLIGSIAILFVGFVTLTRSLASRIFLLEVLDQYGNIPRKDPVKDKHWSIVEPAVEGIEEWSTANILRFEQEKRELNPMLTQAALAETYQSIWEQLSPREQFVLYDFAMDKLANYKTGYPLFSLIEKGILCVGKDGQLDFMTRSFHNFVLNQSDNKEVLVQLKKAREQGSWQSVRTPLFLILAAAGLFVFFTQEEAYQKITGLFASVSGLVPLLSRFFGKEDK